MYSIPTWAPAWLPRVVRKHRTVTSGLLDYEDVMSELLLKLWERRQRGKQLITQRLVGWMLVSMTRERLSRGLVKGHEIHEGMVTDGSPNARLEARAELLRIEARLAGQPTETRRLFLFIAEGATVREASLAAGLAPATGHRRFHRIKALLRETLTQNSETNKACSGISYAV